MQTQAYYILLLLKDYPLAAKKFKEELLQSLYFNDSEDADNWIEKLAAINWVEYKNNYYFITETGLKKLLNRESLNPVRYNNKKLC